MSQQEKEQNWKAGFHVSGNGKRTDLNDLDDSHLQNMIRKYKAEGCDVTALEEELNNRA